MQIADVFDSLKARECVSNSHFDRLYPPHIRRWGERHWTSITVALEAAAFLAEHNACDAPRKIIDVGSGAGKFCIVGALSTDAFFVGAEHRRELSDIARGLVREYKIERVRFVCKDALELDWSDYTGAYLFNPFQENVEESAKLDDSVSCRPENYKKYVAQLEAKLAKAPTGFRLVTYYGFGGVIPSDYERVDTATDKNLEFFVRV